MRISCNKLKSYIKNANTIDWLNIWNTFTIRSSEVESVTEVGKDLTGVVVAQILTCENHPTKEKYHILKVTDGKKEYNILCGAPNVREDIKVPLIKVGGTIGDITIEPKKIAGVLSEGMLCSMVELGIGSDHSGILILPDEYPLGVDLKSILPIEDIIVEIDNKSLTNRPDMWGHYGIAREICAITNHELLPIPTYEEEITGKELNIVIKCPELCYRYTGIKISNIKNNVTPLDMQIFLHYTGMRSINLLVDLTNYLMLELGLPMHAFNAKKVNSILADTAMEHEEFVTLDDVKRTLSSDTLMIKDKKTNLAIAGVMGGLNSEVLENTDSIILESACFDATSVRKTATSLGLRTEASSRYEKSLDPNLTIISLKRFIYLLKENNPDIVFKSSITDVYPTVLEPKEIVLDKELLYKYLGFVITDKKVKEILESLEFKVKVLVKNFKVIVPTIRGTKDVTLEADLIEEIARMYGYENFKPEPLLLDLTFKNHETTFMQEYEAKSYLATKFNLNEVHSYLWYETSSLKELNIEKENVKLLSKENNNILRDDLVLSLLPMVKTNLRNTSKLRIFEIGTIIKDGENKRTLGIILVDDMNNIEGVYYKAKYMVTSLFQELKNCEVKYREFKNLSYYDDNLSKEIIVNDNVIGSIDIIDSGISSVLGKKKVIVTVAIDFDKYVELNKQDMLFKSISKYPIVTLDYTIILDDKDKYSKLENVLNRFDNEFVINYELFDTYRENNNIKYTIRFKIGSNDRTLTQDDLNEFRDEFILYIKRNDLDITI